MSQTELPVAFERLFALSPDLLFVADERGAFTLVNDAFTATLGFAGEAIYGLPVLSLVHPDDQAHAYAAWQRIQEGEVVLGLQTRIRHAEGHDLMLEWSASWDPAHKALYASARDVTEQANHYRRLQAMQEALFNHTIYAKTDTHGVITMVSDLFCEVSGYSREELIGQTHALVNSGAHSGRFFDDLWRTVSSGKVWTGLIKNRKKNGDFYYVQSVLFPVFDLHGDIIEYHAIRQDITEIIRGRSENQRILEILNETNAIAKIGGWELDIASGELSWTDETFEILEVDKVAGQRPVLAEGLELFDGEYGNVVAEAVRRGIEFGEPYSLEVMARTAKGNTKWVFTNGRPNYKNGKIVSLSGTIQDIDERKKALDLVDLERRKSIQNAKLASLGELAASIAHEINNPLTIISGNAEMMERTADRATPEKTQQRVAAIAKSCDRIAQMVKTLKKYSRSDEVAIKQPCHLAEIAREATLLTSATAKRDNIDVLLELDETVTVLGNEIQLEQVVINLINNAIDAVRPLSERRVAVAVFADTKGAVMTVTDSGSGIPADRVNKIFEPFYTTKRSGEGTGLGLAIIRDILSDHGATIEIDRECPNTRFVIRFALTPVSP